MPAPPRPTPFVCLSAAVLVVPAAMMLLLSLCLLAGLCLEFITTPKRAVAPLLFALSFPVPSLLLLFAEYRAFGRQCHTTAFWIGAVCLLGALLSAFALLQRMFGPTGFLAADGDRSSWDDLLRLTPLVAAAACAGIGHLRWHWILAGHESRRAAMQRHPQAEREKGFR